MAFGGWNQGPKNPSSADIQSTLNFIIQTKGQIIRILDIMSFQGININVPSNIDAFYNRFNEATHRLRKQGQINWTFIPGKGRIYY
jgi:hypothetical protein